MDPAQLQKSLFAYIKTRLSDKVSLVNEIADLLKISNDSAYRRIRGEKELTFSEINILSGHFHFSVDDFVGLDKNTFIFKGALLDGKSTGLKEYLDHILQVLQNGLNNPGMRFYLEAKDILPLHHFIIPELAAFKLFFWSKTLFKEENSPKIFRPEDFDGDLVTLAETVSKTYVQIPATEIWHTDTLNSSLRQVNFLWQSGYLSGKSQALHLFDRMREMIGHIEEEVSAGEKFLPGSAPSGNHENFKLYFNDVLLGHNTILTVLNESMQVFINHNVINFMQCTDDSFCKYTYQVFQNLMRKSYCISVTNEKDRSRFFNNMRTVIAGEMDKL